MKVALKHICRVLILILIPALVSCDGGDDLVTIFTGKTWKLSRLTIPGSSAQFPQSFWSDETSFNNSMKAFKNEKNFTIIFEGVEVNNVMSGTSLTAKGIKATLSGVWDADNLNRNFSISNVRVTTAETDILAKTFIAGLQTAYKYDGNANSLVIYFKHNGKDMIMGFTPKR